MQNINIKFNIDQLVEVVKQLSPKEKVKINEAIWNDNYSIPQSHQKLVLSRVAEAKKKPELMLKWADAKKMLVD